MVLILYGLGMIKLLLLANVASEAGRDAFDVCANIELQHGDAKKKPAGD
jgi:hypothetical protein